MGERLVDVVRSNGLVIHTYPITLDETSGPASESDFRAKALEAAAHGQLVADPELESLTARMHISRSGRLEPVDDDVSIDSETRLGLEQSVRERAHAIWEDEGRPVGQAQDHWNRAMEQHLRERAYVFWQQQGSPDVGADEDWRRLSEFQAN